MNPRVFQKHCENWKHKSWTRGNLINYWQSAGLSLNKILSNKKRLATKTNSMAILGSVGKTTLSRILSSLLNHMNISHFITKINDNWLPQLPLAVESALRNPYEVCIFECGVSRKGDSQLMNVIVPANYIVYTEFSEVNLIELKSILEIVKEKLDFIGEKNNSKLVSHVFNKKYIQKIGFKNIIYYGPQGTDAQITYNIKEISETKTIIEVKSNKEIMITINDVGFHLGSACCGAIAAFTCYNEKKLNIESIKLKFKNPPQRMEKFIYKNVVFIIDTANANFLSIINSLSTLIMMKSNMRKNAVLGQIYNLGIEENRIMNSVIDYIIKSKTEMLSSLHLIGSYYLENHNEIYNNVKCTTKFYNDEEDFKAKFNINNYSGEVVLLRGPSVKGKNLSNILQYYDGNSLETSLLDVMQV